MKNNKNFSEDYINFKNWNSNDFTFGKLSNSEYLYYYKEFKRAKIDGDRIFEIGFGNGSFLTFCRKLNLNIIGYEINPVLTELAIKNNYNVIKANDLNSFYKNNKNKISAVFLFDVIEHLDFEELSELLSNLVYILKPGGKIVCRFPNGDSSLSLPYWNGDFTHKSHLGYGKLKYLSKISNLNLTTYPQARVYLDFNNPLKIIYLFFTEPVRLFIRFIVKILYNPTDMTINMEKNLVCIFTKKV